MLTENLSLENISQLSFNVWVAMKIWRYVTKNQSRDFFIRNNLLKLWTCFDISELKDLKNLKKKRVLKNGRSSSGKQD